MGTKFSEDIVPLTDLKVNPGRVVKHAAEAHRPVLLTSRGRGAAVGLFASGVANDSSNFRMDELLSVRAEIFNAATGIVVILNRD
jgi:hypothetical protein